MAEISTKPYLIRAIHEWCTDSGFTPYIAVVVDEHTIVPRGYVKAGEIVLNVSSMATNRLRIDNDLIEFEARFGGVAQHISVPIDNVSAIYARENGHGMAFEVPKPPAVAALEGARAQGAEGAAESDRGADGESGRESDRGSDGEPDRGSDRVARGAEGETDRTRGQRPRAVSPIASATSDGEAADTAASPSRRRPSPPAPVSGGAGREAVDADAAAPRRIAPRPRKPLALAPEVGARSSGKTTAPAAADADKSGDTTDEAAPTPDDGGPDDGGPPKRGKPRLTRVK